MEGKYEAMIRRYACSWDEVGGGRVVDIGTARNVTEKADAEIAEAEKERIFAIECLDTTIKDRDYAYKERDRLRKALEHIKTFWTGDAVCIADKALTPHESSADAELEYASGEKDELCPECGTVGGGGTVDVVGPNYDDFPAPCPLCGTKE